MNLLKRYGRVWFFIGRVHMDGEKRAHIGRAWLTTVLPPYYKGQGIEVRLGTRCLRVGTCRMYGTYNESAPTWDDLEEERVLAGWSGRLDQNVEDVSWAHGAETTEPEQPLPERR